MFDSIRFGNTLIHFIFTFSTYSSHSFQLYASFSSSLMPFRFFYFFGSHLCASHTHTHTQIFVPILFGPIGSSPLTPSLLVCVLCSFSLSFHVDLTPLLSFSLFLSFFQCFLIKTFDILNDLRFLYRS